MRNNFYSPYDLFRESDFTPCPKCRASRDRAGASVFCANCKRVEAVSANNARVSVVESLPPLGQDAY